MPVQLLKDFVVSPDVNGSHNTNYIKQISNSLKKQNELNDKNNQTRPQFRYQEGQSVNAIWAVRSLGIDPGNGREIYLNRNDSMTYIWNPLDKVVVGDAIADLRSSHVQKPRGSFQFPFFFCLIRVNTIKSPASQRNLQIPVF